MTAKPDHKEKKMANHHLYDVVDIFCNDFNINKYRTLALCTIDDII